jgi:hypothetical protein
MGFLRIDTHRYAHARTGQGQQPSAPSLYQLAIDYVYTNSIHPISDSIRFKGIVTRGQHSTASIGPTTGKCLLPIAYCLLHTYVRHPLLYRCSTFRSLLLLLSSRDRDGRDRKKKGRTTTIISGSFNIYFIRKPQQQQHHVDVLAAAGIQYYNVINRRRALIFATE